MAESVARNAVLALCVFVVVVVLAYTNLEFAEPVTEYVEFVVTTDFSVQPFLERTGLAAKWDSLNLGSFLQGWSGADITTGW
ncbi:MAG: hypothetical protein GX249_04765 [Firmicutes bacterium]|nr:hypothetical protein [Bacillota bacterium]